MVGGHLRETGKRGEGGCKKIGGRNRKTPGGNPRVWRLGGLGPVWAVLSHLKIYFFFCKIICNLIFENGDDCLAKIFSVNFRKIK